MFAWNALQGTARQVRATLDLVAFDAAFLEADYTQTVLPKEVRSSNCSETGLGLQNVLPKDAVEVHDKDESEKLQLYLHIGPLKLPVAYLAIEITLYLMGVAPLSDLLQYCCMRRNSRRSAAQVGALQAESVSVTQATREGGTRSIVKVNPRSG